MVLKVLIIAFLIGGAAGIVANGMREDPNSLDFKMAEINAKMDGTKHPVVADNWPEEQPVLFGGAVGVGVFVVGLLVVVAINSDQSRKRD